MLEKISITQMRDKYSKYKKNFSESVREKPDPVEKLAKNTKR